MNIDLKQTHCAKHHSTFAEYNLSWCHSETSKVQSNWELNALPGNQSDKKYYKQNFELVLMDSSPHVHTHYHLGF